MRWWGLTVCVWFAAGCLQSATVTCPDGIVCPASRVCSPVGGCVLQQQLDACDPEPTDKICALPDGSTGGCFTGVCLQIGCGNGVVEPGERCDDGNTIAGDGCSETCDSDERCGNGVLDLSGSEACDCGDAALPADERPAACSGQANSSAAGARCTDSCQIVGCGDGVVSGLEDCDGPDLGARTCADVGFYGGSLACSPSCRFDVAACTGRCGDGERNGLPGQPVEACDGADLGIADCTTFDFYAPDGLTCNAICGFDTSACTGRCNDGAYQAGSEACDPVEDAAALMLRGIECTDFGFHLPGGLACGASCQFDTSACTGGSCGDGIVNGNEQCDGLALASMSCSNFGFHVTDGLACRDNCTFELSGCSERCGDGEINGPEQCDGTVLPVDIDCTTYDFYGPVGLTCNAACALDTTGCAVNGKCGDGTINAATEQCDGASFRPDQDDCTDFGYYAAANLACTSGCTLDLSGCASGGTCGDNSLQSPPEACEVNESSADLATRGFDCTDFSFYQPGGLTCTAGCGFDTSACKERCGDGAVNGTEACDGAPAATYDCVSAGFSGGQRTCAGGCYETFEHCHRIGFQSEFPGASVVVRDTWGVGRELFAAGSAIVHTSGGAWSPQAPLDTEGIWGSSTTNVVAVGKLAGSDWGIYHYGGTTWSPMAGPVSPVALHDVWGTSASNIWAVGDGGAVLQYTTAWNARPSPTAQHLRGVWASSASNVFVVGDNGARYRWTGSSWTNQSTGDTADDFVGIWGRDATEIYAVTSRGSIFTWNGASWSVSTTAPLTCTDLDDNGTPDLTLTGVGGLASAGARAVVVVGHLAQTQAGVICQLANGIWHRLDIGTQPRLNGVGSSERRIAVGGNSTILSSDGGSWIELGDPGFSIGDVWAASASRIYAVGNVVTQAQRAARWDGRSWTPETVPSSTLPLNAIWGGTGWAVAVGNAGAIIASNLGGTWTDQSVSLPGVALTGVWGDDTNVFAVGEGGTILHRATSGTTWTPHTGAPSTISLGAVWGVPGGPVFAVGSAGTILRYAGGTTWTPMTSGTSNSLSAIWGRSATEVYAGGGGVVVRYDGLTWTRVATDSTIPGGSLTGNATEALIVGGIGLVQYIGGRWLPTTGPDPTFQIGDAFGMSDMVLVFNFSEVRALVGRTWTVADAETDCADVWDDDGDGLTDCADPQCSTAAACAGSGGCRPIVDLACNQSVPGTTVFGATRWPYYGDGCSNRDSSGPEAYFRVRRQDAGDIELRLSGYTANLDLIVSQTTATGACTPDERCLAAAQTNNVTEENVTISGATADTDYIVIVDGFAGAASSFSLQVTCP